MTNGSRWVRIGGDLVNLDAVAGAHQEGPTLYVYLNGGRFLAFKDEDASRMWNVLREESAELSDEVAAVLAQRRSATRVAEPLATPD